MPDALEKYAQVYVALHVPPFAEACWHRGKIPTDANDPYLPHFTCRAAGDALLDLATLYPQRQITVLCGHTHGSGDVYLRDNLHIITGGAEYGDPRIQRIFEFA
jgi:hypothetical protein